MRPVGIGREPGGEILDAGGRVFLPYLQELGADQRQAGHPVGRRRHLRFHEPLRPAADDLPVVGDGENRQAQRHDQYRQQQQRHHRHRQRALAPQPRLDLAHHRPGGDHYRRRPDHRRNEGAQDPEGRGNEAADE
jgi:hypothetical protein